jgi:hypothetical protein
MEISTACSKQHTDRIGSIARCGHNIDFLKVENFGAHNKYFVLYFKRSTAFWSRSTQTAVILEIFAFPHHTCYVCFSYDPYNK